MGVAGAGKTTIGHALAAELGWRFIEGDDRHPPENVEKIRAGRGLSVFAVSRKRRLNCL